MSVTLNGEQSATWSLIDKKVKIEENGDDESKSQTKRKTAVKPPPRLKRKNTSLREALERRVGEVEKLVESKAGKIYVENMEKRAWLQAMEAWIVHKYKTRTTLADHQHEDPARGYSSDSELNNPDKKRSRLEKNKLPGDDNNDHVSVIYIQIEN